MPVAVAQRTQSLQMKDRRVKQNTKQTHFGIEVAKGLVWREWEPGGEYTKHVILKNVNVKTQKFKYSSPSSRFFSTLYPEPVVLSAGTSFKLPVTFRPLEKNVYEDNIEFYTQDGSFKVPIVAVLPQYELSLPLHLDFGMCASQDQTQLTFELINVSELKTEFQWFVDLPFVLDPAAGCLDPKSTCKIVATFKPTASLVYETVAECVFGDKLACRKVLKLEGIGKYPHLLVSADGKHPSASETIGIESIVSFGEVAIGATGRRCIELHNYSPVNAPFTIEHPTAKTRMDTVFHCTEHHGIVPALSTCKVHVTFTPNTVAEDSVDYLEVHAIGNVSKMDVKLIGKCKGPKVSLGNAVLDFGRINSGDSSTCTLKIINDSDVAALFQFHIDGGESVFHVSVDCDTVMPHTTQTIIIQFKPVHPINYYRRLTCLVQNQDPLFVDLIGTCHTELVKPAILQPKHLKRYRIHEARGFSLFPPEQLNEMLMEGKLLQDQQGYLMHPQAESLEEFLQPPEPVPPMKEFFSNPYSKTSDLPLHVSMDVQEVDFGCCQNLQHVEQRTVNVTNHTKGKITIVWMGDTDHIFNVSPTSSDIPPLKMTSFRVTFKPDAPNKFYGSELEGYAFYKSMRDYRLVQDETFCPPWCLTVSAVGSTFQPGHETFLPRYAMDNTKLVFPAVDVGDSTYKTLLLTNTGDTPIHYRIPPDPNRIFEMKPCLGLVQRKQQLFAIKTTPKEKNKKLQHTFCWLLNESAKHTLEIIVRGSSEQPSVLLDSEGVLSFKPTCLGTSSSRVYKVRNISRVPLQFVWTFADADKSLLNVEPSTGTILPNESQVWAGIDRYEQAIHQLPVGVNGVNGYEQAHVWTFTPQREEKYVFKPYMQIEDVKHIGDLQRRKRVTVRVIGEGSQGDITAEETSVDLSYTVVGTAVSKDLALFNNSNCTLHYKLYVEQILEGSYAKEIAETEPIALELNSARGVIPARSRCVVQATVRPRHRLDYTFNIFYELCMPELNDEESSSIKGSRKPLCEVKGVGVYPALQVTDARCYGSASGISKSRLWRLFSLDNLNMTLESDPLPKELNYVSPTRHSTSHKVPSNTRAVMDFNFSAAPAGSEHCVVHLMLENKGTVATDWAFLFPADLHLELEYWAETGEFDVEELHEMRVMDNKLFTVEPSRGQLAPGQQQAISFSYKHDFAGTDRLPVMFKISRGREILLNFVGVTIDPERKYVHFPSNKHMFEPVPIGNTNNPHQIYEMYNGGALPVEYYLDLTALELLQKDNFDQRILDCLNPKGEIGPGKTANIEWIFAPFEAKTYTACVPMHIIGGDTALITFSGVGYDSRNLGGAIPATDQMESLVPVTQKVPIPGQLVYLSQERISFGNMPVFSQSRRVVYVKNNSPNHSISFEWFVTSEADGQVIDIQPASATLEPGEVCMCKVCFTAMGEASFYDLDVICEITDEAVMADYESELRDWEKERERQKYEFTITDKDLSQPSSRERLCSTIKAAEEGRKSSSPDEFKKYNTLPPIKHVESDKEIEIRTNQERQTKTGTPLWGRPSPPEPFVLHLGVTGRTLDISEFQSNSPNEVANFYIDRSMADRIRPQSQMEQEKKGKGEAETECSEGEREVIEGTVANIIRALLDDHDFHEALKEIPKEPTPYFSQFGDRPQSLSRLGDARLISPPLREFSQDIPEHETTTQSVSFMEENIPKLESRNNETPTQKSPAHPSADNPPPQDPGSVVQVCPSGHTDAEYQQSLMEERQRNEQQMLKRCPEFGMLLESVLENTLFNMMSEAVRREVNLTARPRLIALPPSQKPQTPPKAKMSRSRSGSAASMQSEISRKSHVVYINNNNDNVANGHLDGQENQEIVSGQS